MKTFLWGRIEKLMDNLHSYCIQAWHLERVLSKMRNPSTNLSLLEDLIKVNYKNNYFFPYSLFLCSQKNLPLCNLSGNLFVYICNKDLKEWRKDLLL